MFELTVVEPFTMPLGEGRGVREFAVGERIEDQALVDEVGERFPRNVARHYAVPKPAKAAAAPAAPKPQAPSASDKTT